MSYLGSWKIDDNLTFPAVTHRFDTGALTDADSVPSYRVYEDEIGTAILTGSMAKLDDANTTGFYSEQIALSAANGFEKGKCYTIYITAAVNSVTGGQHHTFQMEAEVDANRVNWANVDNPTTTVNLSGTTVKTATDVETDTQDIQSRLPAALTGSGNIKADAQVVSDKTGYTLTSAYDAAKTAASQTSVDDLPTNAELATALAGADDATLAAIAALNNLSAAQVNAEVDTALSDVGLTGTVTGRIDAAISSRMATYTQPTGFLAATFPSDPADQSLVIAATDALAALIGDVPTNAELTTALAGADDAMLAAISGLSIPTANQNADALLDRADGIETGLTPRGALRLVSASLAGELAVSGNTVTIRNVGDTKDRITATTDDEGQRTAVTTDAS